MSIFKRLFRDRDDPNNVSVPTFKPQNANIKALGSNLQKRFSRGVQYNMKILIRGDRNVGKSALLNRLKGNEFVDQYIPTEEIEVACVHWSYKCTEDVIKVEVWDVVDKGRKKTPSGLKLENINYEETPKPLCLDAEFLDVYKGAHGVILVLDMTKSWTYNYVERELLKLPADIAVLVLANHRDMGHHRTVTPDQVLTMLEPLPGYKKGLIKYWESSMKNGYGLVYIHRFFNLPFLMLQRDTLLRQLITNEGEMKTTQEDLEDFEESLDNEYDNFIKSLKTCKISSPPEKPSSLTLHSSPSSQINSPSSPGSQGSTTPNADFTHSRPPIHPPQARPIPGMEKLGLYPLPVPSDNNVVPSELEPKDTIVTAAMSIASTKNKGYVSEKKKEIFDFVPDEQPELSMFLDDSTSPRSPDTAANVNIDSSSDEDNVTVGPCKNVRSNPMVAMFQDDVDVDDVSHVSPHDNGLHARTYEPSSSDDERSDAKTSQKLTPQNLGVTNVSNAADVTTMSKVSSTHTLVEDSTAAPYSEIIFDATDLDMLDQMFSKKEMDADVVTVNSSGSVKHKKKKKHHKQTEIKDSTLKMKKKSSKKSEEESSHDKSSSHQSKQLKKVSSVHVTSTMSTNAPPVLNGDFSDSLEKFLNE